MRSIALRWRNFLWHYTQSRMDFHVFKKRCIYSEKHKGLWPDRKKKWFSTKQMHKYTLLVKCNPLPRNAKMKTMNATRTRTHVLQPIRRRQLLGFEWAQPLLADKSSCLPVDLNSWRIFLSQARNRWAIRPPFTYLNIHFLDLRLYDYECTIFLIKILLELLIWCMFVEVLINRQ